jgi:uncharacterized phage-associated protein
MAGVLDVAQYILQKQGVMSVMKLQKLVYYCQAWSLVWDEKPLFNENIEAWANGPVVRKLYNAHKGKFEISSLTKGNPDNLTPAERETIDAVLECYGDKTAQWLSDLTHLETPWSITREGLPPGTSCDKVISHACMHEYYSSLPVG